MASLPRLLPHLTGYTNTCVEDTGVFSFCGPNAWAVFEELCRKIYFPIEPIPKDQLMLFYGSLSYITRGVNLPPGHQLNKEELDLTRHFCEEKFLQGVQTYEVMAHPSLSRVYALYLAVGPLVSSMLAWKNSGFATDLLIHR